MTKCTFTYFDFVKGHDYRDELADFAEWTYTVVSLLMRSLRARKASEFTIQILLYKTDLGKLITLVLFQNSVNNELPYPVFINSFD